MEVVILAGGFGHRLSTVVSNVPKPMAPVKNRPFLEFILKWLALYNVEKIVLSVGYKSESIISFFGNEFDKIPLLYAIEKEPLGTGGGILNSINAISDENFLIVNGDTYFPIDLNVFREGHLTMGGEVTVALRKMTDFERYGSVDIDEKNNIIHFDEKKFKKEGLINCGIYMVKKSFINGLNLPFRCSFEKDVLEKYHKGNEIKGIEFPDCFLDIGVPEDYSKADHIL